MSCFNLSCCTPVLQTFKMTQCISLCSQAQIHVFTESLFPFLKFYAGESGHPNLALCSYPWCCVSSALAQPCRPPCVEAVGTTSAYCSRIYADNSHSTNFLALYVVSSASCEACKQCPGSSPHKIFPATCLFPPLLSPLSLFFQQHLLFDCSTFHLNFALCFCPETVCFYLCDILSVCCMACCCCILVDFAQGTCFGSLDALFRRVQ